MSPRSKPSSGIETTLFNKLLYTRIKNTKPVNATFRNFYLFLGCIILLLKEYNIICTYTKGKMLSLLLINIKIIYLQYNAQR